jgi:PEP-CTERM motif
MGVTLAFAVPEPETYALMLGGLVGLAALRRREHHSSKTA